MTSPQQLNFNGFTLPDGAWLPPELLLLLPLLSNAQLKITVAAIYHHTQVGGSEPLTLKDFEELTGLSHQTVISSIRWLLGQNEHGLQILEREQCDRSYIYRLRLDIHKSLKIRLSDGEKSLKTRLITDDKSLKIRLSEAEKERESESKLININLNSLSDSLSKTNLKAAESLEIRLSLLKDLQSSGVFLKTAQHLVSSYPEDRIRQKMTYFVYALGMGFANNPGWLVTAIKEDWPAPLGYDPHEKRSYTERTYEICQNCQQDPCICEHLPDPDDGFETPLYRGPGKVLRAFEAAIDQLRMDMPAQAFDTWVSPAWLASYDEDGQVVVVGTRNAYGRDWLQDRLSSQLTRLLTGILNQSVTVRFEVCDAA